MRVQSECYDCLRKLAYQVADLATSENRLNEKAKAAAVNILDSMFKPGMISIVIASEIHRAVCKITGNHDPFRYMKDIEIRTAKRLYGRMELNFGLDLRKALRLAAIGNSIDFFRPIEQVECEIADMKMDFKIDDSDRFEQKVRKARLMLYLADNTGEMFFDMPLLNLMRRYGRTIYVVKESPVQNDVTRDEITRGGLVSVAGEIVTTGTATPGIDFTVASAEFISLFKQADFVLAKGMGYYETLEELPAEERIFFCLKAKCMPVARSLNVPLNSYVATLH